MSKSSDKLKTGSGAGGARRKLSVSARAAGRSFTLPGAVPDEEISPPAVRQNTILSTSARGLVTGSGVGDAQRKLTISTPAAGHMRFALPGAVEEEEEERSLEAHGLVTGSDVRGVRRRSNISTPAASQESIAPPRAAKKEKRRGAEKQTKRRKEKGIRACLQRKLQALMRFCCICPNEDDMEQSDPVNPQPGPSDLQSRAREHNRQNSPSGLEPVGRHKPGCCPPGLNTLKKTDLQEEADPKYGPFDQEPNAQNDQTDSQPGPSGLQSRTREDDRQNSPSGLKPAGCHKPGCCPPGLNTLKKKDLQEEADPKYGPFDQEPNAQNDQTDSQPGPFGLQSRAREHNRQYSPLGLEPAGCHKPGCCLPGLNTLKKTDLREEADPKYGPFDQEPSAQNDQTDSRPGLSGLQSRAREHNRQYSPLGLKPAGCHKPSWCPPGLNTLKKTDLREEADPKYGPFDQEPSAQNDQTDSRQGPSGLQSRAREHNRQYSPLGLKPAGCHKPSWCPPGLNTLKKTDLREEADPKYGPFEQEPNAQNDQTDSQPGPSGLQSRTREDDRQNSPSGLKPVGFHKPGCCPPSLNTLKKTDLQEEADPKYGPFDQQPNAQNDQTDSKPGSSGLQSRTREDDRQNSPPGLDPAGCRKPSWCPTGSSKLKQTAHQDPADPEHGPSDQEPRAQSDPADPQPGPSGLQSSGHQRSHPAREFKSLYRVKKQIGKGGFGTVYEATRKKDGRKVAIKFIEKSWLTESFIEMRGHADPLYSEVAFNLMLLKPEKSPFIVEMLDWFEEKDRYIIVLEYPQPCMDLLDFVESKGGRLSEIQARHLMRQAVLALMHCIDCGIYQVDMKLKNVLVNTDAMHLKLIDFGLCELVKSFGTSSCSGRSFVVAETVHNLGILLYKMLHGTHPSTGTAVISKECQDVLNRCLDHRDRRPTLEELLRHKWFKK